MMLTELLAAFGFLLCLYFHFRRRSRKSDGSSQVPLPPTLKQMPILGSLPWVFGRRVYEVLERFDKESGPFPLCYLKVGNRTSVFINDTQLVRKVFIEAGNETSDRPFLPVFNLDNERKLGIVCAPRARWVANRRFALRVLREFGLGKAHIIDNLIAGEMALFRAKIDATEGQAVKPGPLCNRLVGGVISSLLFGHNLESEGDWFDSILKDTNDFLQENYVLMLFFPSIQWLYTVPFLWRLLPSSRGVASGRRVSKFMESMVADVKASVANTDKQITEASNFVEAYFLDPGNPSQEEGGDMATAKIADAHLSHILKEVFIAGVDTTAMTLEWGLLLLSLHPEVQDRAHDEIEAKLGGHTTLQYRNINDLPFTKAVVHEVARFGCVASASIPHTVTSDMIVETEEKRSYRIPAGCYLHLNIYGLSRSEKYWRRPYDFDPLANFMDDAGEEYLLRWPDAFLPFSIGRRACLGESLARNESFVVLASILQSYRVRLADQYKDVAKAELMEAFNNGVVRGPRQVEVVFQRR